MAYAEYRKAGPTRVRLWNGTSAWLITGYDHVRQVLTDARFSADVRGEGYPFLAAGHRFQRDEPIPFVRMDPPRHGEIRRMFTAEFGQERIAALRPAAEALFAELCDAMLARGGVQDIREAAFLPFPTRMIADMVGVPHADLALFQNASVRKLALGPDAGDPLAAGNAMRAYLDDLLTEKEKAPDTPDDMMGRLITRRLRPGLIGRTDAIRTLEMLLMAGHETTANMTTLGLLSILRQPDLWAALGDNPSPTLVRQTVEEILRYHSAAQFVGTRLCTKDAEVGGVTIRAGEGVLALVNAANRDPAIFDDPDRFDAQAREISRHMAFGFGVHQCLGQALARLEMNIVFTMLPARIPTLRLAVPESELVYRPDALVFGVNALPVTW